MLFTSELAPFLSCNDPIKYVKTLQRIFFWLCFGNKIFFNHVFFSGTLLSLVWLGPIITYLISSWIDFSCDVDISLAFDSREIQLSQIYKQKSILRELFCHFYSFNVYFCFSYRFIKGCLTSNLIFGNRIFIRMLNSIWFFMYQLSKVGNTLS